MDKPWEDGLLNYLVTFWDKDKYRAWYRAGRGNKTGYAESTDGIHWEKPELGLVEHNGSTANNIQISDVHWTHCVLKDHAEPDADRRYKLAYWSRSEDAPSGIYVAFSPDGIHWKNLDEPILDVVLFGAKNSLPIVLGALLATVLVALLLAAPGQLVAPSAENLPAVHGVHAVSPV